ncbi:MAG: hypothetical protein KAS32_23000 [Candidatus Peribacteraceae bacterium]|nr:hypothetical protein [Candidatus Peribacteraceae bacterium]
MDKVPDNIKPFYERADEADESSKFVLKKDPIVGAAVAIVSGAAGALAKERKNRPQAVDLTPLQEYGTTVEEIVTGVTTKMTELEGQVKDGANVKQQIEKMKKEMTVAHAQLVQEKDKSIGNLTTQLDTYMVQTEIDAAAAHYPGLNPKLIAPFAKQRMKVAVDDEGNRSVVILNQDGSEKYSMERGGELANSLELLQDMHKDEQYLALFPANPRRGGDTEPGHTGNHSKKKDADLSPAGKISQGLSKKQ